MTVAERFADRREAGRRLAPAVAARLAAGSDAAATPPVVLGLPRGGVPVAAEVAAALDAPFDVLVVRKLGLSVQPELAMGAIGEDGAIVRNDDVIRRAGIDDDVFDAVEQRERAELEARATRFRSGRPGVDLAGRTAILVDDGLATGATAQVACRVARARGAARVIVAVPVAAREASARLRGVADDVIVLVEPQWFSAVGLHYADFRQTSDAEVVALLAERAS